MKKLLVFCLLGFALTGCDNQLKIDGANEIALKTSIENIRDTLSEDKKLKFDESLYITMVNSINFDDLFKDNKNGNINHKDIEQLEQNFFHYLNGKTADQIIAEAEQIKATKVDTQ
ncbi:hypothetical protein FE392_04725 [Xenorhabdus sp. 12]|uniref:Lipoprotein n=1 Tax=Xenorhabdus santafensis TaxID=2582833 RepID=A0ABU4S6I4_9GAMM|nr:DUF6694 family lipoprotein [Xenorhabdus sp. 12]MDX7986641.1 hypothetical protein [Xenorhabdus sp. 12]